MYVTTSVQREIHQAWSLPWCPSDAHFSHVSFTKEKMPWYHYPFKNEAYRPVFPSERKLYSRKLKNPETHLVSVVTTKIKDIVLTKTISHPTCTLQGFILTEMRVGVSLRCHPFAPWGAAGLTEPHFGIVTQCRRAPPCYRRREPTEEK